MAQAGHLDPTFGNGQPGLFSFSQNSAFSTAVALQSDGKIVIAGQVGGHSALLRLTTNGELDSSFGSGGVVTTRIGGDINQIFTSLAIQTDGKILVTATGCPARNVLARFNPNGSQDTTFGSSGFAAQGLAQGGLTLQSDGKILVTGETFTAGSFVPIMTRLLSDGQPDTSFGSNGQAPLVALASAVALQSDGKILVGSGSFLPVGGSLVRYNSNGSLDKTFGIFGQAGSITPIVAVAVQIDGKILAVGANTSRLSLNGNSSGFGLIRFNLDGSLDTTFGTRAGVTTGFPSAANAGASAVRLQINGDIVAAGSAANSNNSSFALARYLSTGKLDSTFGSGGLVTTGFGSGQAATVASMVIQGDGKIVVAGSIGGGTVIEVARYLGQ